MDSDVGQDEGLSQASTSRFTLWGVIAAVVALSSYHFLIRVSRGVLPQRAYVFPIALTGATFSWVYIVSSRVPEPYLDEVFHIPQAQRYCEGRFREWDDKITTPPGLYLISLLIPGVVQYSSFVGAYACSAQSLRTVNAVVLLVLAYLALLCRREIEARLYEAHSPTRLKIFTQYALHTAFNIALFPLLFFFSGLYYTDVLSTAVVLAAYVNHLKRVGRDRSSILSDLSTILLGIFALFMRQTNVFWVVVYMGGLEAIHAVKTLRPERVDQPYMTTVPEQLKFYAWRYSVGDIHDPPLHMLWPDDMVFCVLSLGIAALCNPIRVIRQIWPYIAVLVSFGSFVAWNGGVVLGDKSNHVATIHLAQMLYIWPFFAFFSLPLLVPYTLPFINMGIRCLGINRFGTRSSQQPGGRSIKSESGSSSRRRVARKPRGLQGEPPRPVPPPLSKTLGLILMIFESKVLWPIYLLLTIIISIAIVKFNTIIHPFTLADNRHYMFYVFRYTIRRATWIRYVLIIFYTLARWMTWGTMAGCSQWFFIGHGPDCSAHYRSRDAPFLSHPFWTRCASPARQTDGGFPIAIEDVSPEVEATQQESLKRTLDNDPLKLSSEPASTSTGLIFLLATTLSLITAPLVEPRYFIIPWVMWRLLVPGWRLHDHEVPNNVVDKLCQLPYLGERIQLFRRYDLRLILETIWFIAINAVTGYIFITKPYLWKAEDGSLLDEGRLQRFMW
ncbi:Fc.00g092550.m01.CDS01 [Cosmosporella sp. VM-42]